MLADLGDIGRDLGGALGGFARAAFDRIDGREL